MNKTFKKTYVALGAGLTLFAALSLTLMPSIALALTGTAPITAADGAIGITVNGGTTCTGSERLSWNGSIISCVTTGGGTGTVTGVSAFGSGGLVVTGGASPTPVLGIAACGGTVGTKMLTNKHLSDATWQCDDVPVPLVIGTSAGTALEGNTTIPTVIPAIIAFSTETNLGTTGTTMYASLGGTLSATSGGVDVQTPLPQGTYKNLVCRTSAAVGVTNTTVAFKTSTCNSATLSGGLTLTLPNAATREDSLNTSTDVGGDKCGVIVITRSSAWTTAATITCSLERTS